MGKNVNSCVFYKSFYDAIMNTLDDDSERFATICAILDYAYENKEPDLLAMTRAQRAIMIMAMPQMDANARKRAAGARGGRPKTSASIFDERTSTGKSEANPGKSGGTVYPPIYVPPDDLRRLQMQTALNDLRRE